MTQTGLFSTNTSTFPSFANFLDKFEKDTLLLTNFLKNFDRLAKYNKSINRKEIINLNKIKKFLLIFIIKLVPILENFIILSKSQNTGIYDNSNNSKMIISRIISHIMSVKSLLNTSVSLISLNIANFNKSKMFTLIDIDNSIATLVSMNSRPLQNLPASSASDGCAICKSRIDPVHDKYEQTRQTIQNMLKNNSNRSSSFSDHACGNGAMSSRHEDELFLSKLFENGKVVHDGICYHKDCYSWWRWNDGSQVRMKRSSAHDNGSAAGTMEPLIIL